LSQSIDEGAIKLPGYDPGNVWGYGVLKAAGIDTAKKLGKFSSAEMEELLHAEPRKVKVNGINLTFDGLENVFTKKYILRDLKTMSERTQKQMTPFITLGACHLCRGARLSQPALAVKVDGHNIADLSAMQVDALLEVVSKI